jgi:hypothetical protein
MLTATITGVADAVALIAKLQDGVAGLSGQSIAVGTSIVYAWGQEFGVYQSGRLARKAGPSLALTGAFAEFSPDVVPALAQALPLGAAAVQQVLMKTAVDIQGGAAVHAPRLTGTLAASYTVIPGWR